MADTPVIPTTITVHMGSPTSSAQNVIVPFTTYLQVCASAEIYPTWPYECLRANIYAITSFALNRVYTEYYRSRGYDFDITNDTAYDQSYSTGGNIYGTIADIVNEQFNDYIVRRGQIQPLFAAYCSGTTVTCEGLSQWGSVYLANIGYTALQILRYYYGNDISIVENAPVQNITRSYPGLLSLGSAGEDVRTLQRELNRISQNYPAIPKISSGEGVYNAATRKAVIAFQQIFDLDVDGVVGKATWYKIKEIYNGVKKLSEVYSEGLTLGDVSKQYLTTLRRGNRGDQVRYAQFYLNFIGKFDPVIPIIDVDGVFGPKTQEAVEIFQRQNGLTVDGIIGRNTWNAIVSEYENTFREVSDELGQQAQFIFPGYVITTGMSGNVVYRLQSFLRAIAENDSRVPLISADGIFGEKTAAAVRAVQAIYGLPQTGAVAAFTWNAIVELYNEYQ